MEDKIYCVGCCDGQARYECCDEEFCYECMCEAYKKDILEMLKEKYDMHEII